MKKNTTTGTNSNKGIKDNNSAVVSGSIINGAEVTEKRQQAVVMKYELNGNTCTGVMHVSQFPSTERHVRDRMFAEVTVGAKFDGLEAAVEPADKAKGRRFTSVRLSGRAPMEKAAQARRQEREDQRKAFDELVNRTSGKVVTATVKKLAFAKDKESGQETDHCFGAFLNCQVEGVEISGLLHTSRMTGKNRAEQLVERYQDGTTFEVVLSKTDKGVSFSEVDVQAAREAAAAAERDQRQAGERENFLSLISEALTAGTAEKMPFPARVTENRLDCNGGVSCVACGVRVEVSSEDLEIPAQNMRGIGHQVKLFAVGIEDGVISAKRYIKR